MTGHGRCFIKPQHQAQASIRQGVRDRLSVPWPWGRVTRAWWSSLLRADWAGFPTRASKRLSLHDGRFQKGGALPWCPFMLDLPPAGRPLQSPPWQVSGSLYKHWDGETWGGPPTSSPLPGSAPGGLRMKLTTGGRCVSPFPLHTHGASERGVNTRKDAGI